ncbi:MAG: M20/M25/M40 family metallo-hydrolase [Bacteroidales bacterium]
MITVILSFVIGSFLTMLPIPAASSAGDSPQPADSLDPARLLSSYVQIPSVSGEEKEAGEFLADFCQDQGLHVHVFTDEPDSYNFAASLYPLEESKPNIVLLSHIDVVPPGNPEGWTYPPFSGTIADGKVWGRGAIDNKAMGVMHVLAVIQFVERAQEEDLPYNVSVLAVSGEETGGDKGARIIASEYLDELNPAVVYAEGGAGVTGIITAEPDMPVFGIGVAQKRRMFMAIESSVQSSGHGSVPRDSYSTKEVVGATKALLDAKPRIVVSPVVKEALNGVALYESSIRSRVLENVDFFAPLFGRFLRTDPLIISMLTNTTALTRITSADGAYNQIPTDARAVFDCRLLPETDEETFIARVEDIVEDYDVTIDVIRSSPTTPTSERGLFYDVLDQAVVETFEQDVVAVPFMFMAINDNRFFRREGIPAYGLLPAIMPEELMESIHYFDERMPVEGLEKGIQVYVNLINRLISDQL